MIYIHIPFCATRCLYCDFYSTTLRGRERDYVAALEREMIERRDFLSGPIRTLYLGGGTPSQLGQAAIEELIAAVARHFDLSQCEELTMEANPEDIIDEQLWPLGLTSPLPSRISMGVQSMVDSELTLLRRRHSAEEVRHAMARLRAAGIHNISLDLMYGLPTQTMASWEYSIDELLKLRPEHISAYNLAVEEGTRLSLLVKRGELNPCDDETCVSMAALLRQKLRAAGYEQYEISNYALPGYHSRHNSAYWVQTPYLGLGPGAHSYDGNRRRSWNEPRLLQYLKGVRQEGYELLTDLDLYNERVMLGLRTRWGVPLDAFAPYPTALSILDDLCQRGLVHINNDHAVLTEAGLALGDEVMRELFVVGSEE